MNLQTRNSKNIKIQVYKTTLIYVHEYTNNSAKLNKNYKQKCFNFND